MDYGLHIIENPKGHKPGFNFSLVGSIPVSMLDWVEPTKSDVMGGRVVNGKAPKGRQWETVAQIKQAAAENGVELCSSPDCMCARLFKDKA